MQSSKSCLAVPSDPVYYPTGERGLPQRFPKGVLRGAAVGNYVAIVQGLPITRETPQSICFGNAIRDLRN